MHFLPDDEHPYLLYDCEPLSLFDDEHRSFYYDFHYLGVPSKRSFPPSPWGPRKLSICGERRNHSKFKRACSFGLACAFRRGRALQGFTSSALLHNTKFEPFDLLPLKGNPSKVRSHPCANQIFVAPSKP